MQPRAPVIRKARRTSHQRDKFTSPAAASYANKLYVVNRLTTGATWRCARFRRPRQTSTPCGSIRACGGNARLAGPGRFTKRHPTNKAANSTKQGRQARSSTRKARARQIPVSRRTSRMRSACCKGAIQSASPTHARQGVRGVKANERHGGGFLIFGGHLSDAGRWRGVAAWTPSSVRPRAEPPCQMRDSRLIAVCAIAKVLGAGVQ